MIEPGKAVQLILSVLLGAGVGWAAQALTLAGRVDALERGQEQVIERLDRIIAAKGLP